MRILVWNIRGLGSAGRRKQLIELVNKFSFDCICLQETIKSSFRLRELDRFAGQSELFIMHVKKSVRLIERYSSL